MKNKYSWLKHLDFFFLDLICLLFSFFMAYYLRHRELIYSYPRLYRETCLTYVLSDLFFYLLLNPYSDVLRRGYLVELEKTIEYDIFVSLFVTTYLFIVKSGSEYSRITFFLTLILYIITSYIVRICWKKRLREKALETVNSGEKSLLIICKNNEAEKLIDKFRNNNYDFYQISGICVLDKNRKGETISDCPIVADKKTLTEFISSNWIDDIFISSYDSLPDSIMKQLLLTGIPVHIKIEEIKDLGDRIQTVDNFGTYNTISIVRREYNFFEPMIKRIIDIAGGIIGCFFTLLLIIIIGPIIYIKSPGNIFYVSDRVGKNGKIFKFYKFRSMILNADDLKEDLKKQNRVKDGMMFKIEDDPRIIPGIGSFIRKTSLDEFPQFFNVLKGDMSLVGTRPPTIDEWKKYSPYYRSRLSIKPGITGLWQISGRSEITDFDEVVRLDNEYINNWSIDLDIKILFKTVFILFKGDKGAM